MKLDGAAEPRQGALVPFHSDDCLLGAEENREYSEPCEIQHDTDGDEDAVARKTTFRTTNPKSSGSCARASSAVKFKKNQQQTVCDNKNNHSTKNQPVKGDTKQTNAIAASEQIATEKRRSNAAHSMTLRWPFVATITEEKTENWSSSSLGGSATGDGDDEADDGEVEPNTKTMRAQQSLMAAKSNPGCRMDVDAGQKSDAGLVCGRSAPLRLAIGTSVWDLLTFILCLVSVVALQALPAHCDDGDNFFGVNSFSMGPETTTPAFDYASRGEKKFGDKCDNTLECGFPGSICDPKKKSCQCTEDLPVTNHFDKCGKEAAVNESCFFSEQCEVKYFQTECRDGRCICRFEMTPIWAKDGTVECRGRQDKRGPETYIDPAMIFVLVGMALMFIIICVVLRLFSQARWRENRTIFNTPNPRLMNVSLLRDSKLLHGQERRGSRMSVRAPSRQPSMASLRPHSPNPSLGKTGRMIRSKSNTRSSDSRVSDVSTCSRLLEHPDTHRAHSQFLPYVPTTISNLPVTPTTTTTNVHDAAVAGAVAVTTTTYVSSPSAAPACGMSHSAPSPTARVNKF